MKHRALQRLLTGALCAVAIATAVDASPLDWQAGPVSLDVAEQSEGITLTEPPLDATSGFFRFIPGDSPYARLNPIQDGSFLAFSYLDNPTTWQTEIPDPATPDVGTGPDKRAGAFIAPGAPPDLLNETSPSIPDDTYRSRPLNADIEAQIAIAEPVQVISPFILGIPTPIFESLYIAVRLIGIIAGTFMILAMIQMKLSKGWTAVFLLATATSGGIGLLVHSIVMGVPQAVGILSLLALASAAMIFYGRRVAGVWRTAFIISAMMALYLNVAGGLFETYQALPALNLSPATEVETPFLLVQLAVLVVAVVLAVLATTRVDVTAPATSTPRRADDPP